MSEDNKAAVHRPEKIHSLTSLRFFAALFIVLYHTVFLVSPDFARNLDLSPMGFANRVLSLGFISVGFFFLLSGYILAMVYLNGQKGLEKRGFYIARFARVYPLFFLTLVWDTPYMLLGRIAKYGLKAAIIKTGITFVASALMLHAWIPRLGGIDFPNWSLSVETLFYLVFPLAGVLLWKLRGLRLWVVALALYVVGQLLVHLAVTRLQDEVFKYQPLLHLTTFLLGILLARWQSLERERRGESPKTGGIGMALALLIAVMGFGGIVLWLPRFPLIIFSHGLLVPLFGCVIWAFSGSSGSPARLLSTGWLVVLGEASYGLYLLHIPVLHMYLWLGGDRIPALYPIYLAACIGISVLSFYHFEVPARRWILKRVGVRPRETTESSSDAQ